MSGLGTTVIIAGGGIAGLALGLMLETCSIDYLILERSSHVRPLGSAISLNACVMRLFEQLGMLPDLYRISKLSGKLHIFKENLEPQGRLDLEHFLESYGYYAVQVARPDFYDLLRARIPSPKLLMGKRILSMLQNDLGVMVRCQDGSTYHSDILVAADGAYSSIRQCIYKDLDSKGALPKSDSRPLQFDQHCVVGITDPMDPEQYPVLKQNFCEVYAVMGDQRPYSIWLMPVVGNRFAWSISGRLQNQERKAQEIQSFSYSEWWPEKADEICDRVRDYKLPDLNGTCRDIDNKIKEHHERYKRRQRQKYGHENRGSEEGSIRTSSDSRTRSHASSSTTSFGSTSTGRQSQDGGTGGGSGGRSVQHNRSHSTVTTNTHTNSSSADQYPADPLHEPFGDPSPYQSQNSSRITDFGTMANIIDQTPKDRTSKVMLEEKFFETWSHGRTVMIGDAVHKILPFAGQGGVQAILDAVSLANQLYDLPDLKPASIQKAFKTYKSERYEAAKSSIAGSRSFGKLLNVQGFLSDFVRKITFKMVPGWILKMAADKILLHRPQLCFLPLVPDRGSVKAYPQKLSERYIKAQMDKKRWNADNLKALRQASAISASSAPIPVLPGLPMPDSDETDDEGNAEMEGGLSDQLLDDEGEYMNDEKKSVISSVSSSNTSVVPVPVLPPPPEAAGVLPSATVTIEDTALEREESRRRYKAERKARKAQQQEALGNTEAASATTDNTAFSVPSTPKGTSYNTEPFGFYDSLNEIILKMEREQGRSRSASSSTTLTNATSATTLSYHPNNLSPSFNIGRNSTPQQQQQHQQLLHHANTINSIRQQHRHNSYSPPPPPPSYHPPPPPPPSTTSISSNTTPSTPSMTPLMSPTMTNIASATAEEININTMNTMLMLNLRRHKNQNSSTSHPLAVSGTRNSAVPEVGTSNSQLQQQQNNSSANPVISTSAASATNVTSTHLTTVDDNSVAAGPAGLLSPEAQFSISDHDLDLDTAAFFLAESVAYSDEDYSDEYHNPHGAEHQYFKAYETSKTSLTVGKKKGPRRASLDESVIRGSTNGGSGSSGEDELFHPPPPQAYHHHHMKDGRLGTRLRSNSFVSRN